MHSPKYNKEVQKQTEEGWLQKDKTPYVWELLRSNDWESVNVEKVIKGFDVETDSSLQKFVSADKPFNYRQYTPNLVTIAQTNYLKSRGGYARQIDKRIYQAVKDMARKMKQDLGRPLVVVSSYRSYRHQKGISTQCKRNGYCAWEGTSEHQSGLTMDVGSLYGRFANTKEYGWMKRNAHKFGFTQSYQKGRAIDRYHVEPRHRRYVGVKLATILKNEGKTFSQRYDANK